MIAAFENALVVRLDAFGGSSFPTWALTTTTHRPDFERERLRQCEKTLFRYLRAEYGRSIEYLGFVEFTTGRGRSSGGFRRPHVHHLVKGLGEPDRARAAELEAWVSQTWRRLTGGAWRVECRPLRTPMGAIAYLALHHHKREQQPPKGWSGKRFRPSRGYFERPIADLRAEARALLRDRRIEAQLVDAWNVPDGFDGSILDELLEEALPAARDYARENAPKLVRVTRNGLRPYCGPDEGVGLP